MRIALLATLVTLTGCQTASPRAVVEIYMHPNGLSNCVMTDGSKWVADASCCPVGFTLAGFSAPAVTAFESDVTEKDGDEVVTKKKTSRRIYRHVVCLQDPTP